MSQQSKNNQAVSLKYIFQTWWPLAASWMLMGLELPAISAVIARLENPEINLAAYGGIVFPLALLIESPIIMLLAASTTLSKDWFSYLKIWKFMMWAGASLTGLHILIAFTPLYYTIVVAIIGAPEEIIEPARIGLKIMLPWTWAIAYRRFKQGMLIRFGHSRAISIGTVFRLSANLVILFVGYSQKSIPGIVVATTAVAVGVTTEAVYMGLRSRPVINRELKIAPKVEPPLTYRAFLAFYFPLVMTSLLTLIIQPIGSAALSRMPFPLKSLAVWPVISGLIFLIRGMGIAFNEVVISIIRRPNSFYNLRRFSWILTFISTVIIIIMNITPFAQIWFSRISALSPNLTKLAQNGLWIAMLMPGLNVLQSWFQGAILNHEKTRGITEAVAVFIGSISIILWIGVRWNNIIGLYVGLSAYVVGMLAQTIWLWYRSRTALRIIRERDI
jgi:hypothetical protein